MRFVLTVTLVAGVGFAQSEPAYENPPIEYSKTAPTTRIERLEQQLANGGPADGGLAHDETLGYLPALLKALEIPVESQGLVFSKTSFQNARITPRSPRGVYFGDDAYVGYVPGGDVLEITAMDKTLGPVFYTLDQTAVEVPRFVRRTGECLNCHGASRTGDWPGNLVRSVFPDEQGHPRMDTGSFVTTHRSSFGQRWGGWFVTGAPAAMPHLGNRVFPDGDAPIGGGSIGGGSVGSATTEELQGRPVGSEIERPSLDAHPLPTSDVVALMVLEHQTEMHNLIARARYVAQRALQAQAEINRSLGDPVDHRSASTERQIRKVADAVVEGLLFRREAELPAPVTAPSPFAALFARRGPFDAQGRSLREFDLSKRLFRYPCSYLIYSPSFDALPAAVLDRVYSRLGRVLSGRLSRRGWGMTKEQRRAILDILIATKPGVPASWRELKVR